METFRNRHETRSWSGFGRRLLAGLAKTRRRWPPAGYLARFPRKSR